jgi:hypothetical protein
MTPERPRGRTRRLRGRARWRVPDDPSPPQARGSGALCGAGSWHQQLPDADCPAQGQSVSGRRTVFQDRATGRGAGGHRAAEPRLDDAHHPGAAHLPEEAEKHGVTRMRLVATEACRRARNARDFMRQVRRETGLALEIIAPEEEARLAVISCAPLVSPGPSSFWSSTSAAARPNWSGSTCRGAARGAAARDHAAAWAASARPGRRPGGGLDQRPLGVATLKDQFGDVEDDAARFALMSWFFEETWPSFSPYHAQAPREGFQIIGTSGTVTTVAASCLGPAPL